MSDQQQVRTLDELRELGIERAPKSKRIAAPAIIEQFLSMVFDYDFANAPRKLSQAKEREIEAEIRSFCKAQEKLRELLAIHGTDAIASLADIRDERQRRPQNMAGRRTWIG